LPSYKRIMKLLIFLFFLLPFLSNSQIQGTLLESDSIHPIFHAEVILPTGNSVFSDSSGVFSIDSISFPAVIIIEHPDFVSETYVLEREDLNLKLYLTRKVNNLETVVVSAGRRTQNVLEVPISMETLRPELIANKGITDLEQAVDQTPGVSAMDGQVSIRGGSGFAYGAGSRVLLLWNGMPLLSGDAGDAKWNAIPMESAGQIEVMKGASSVLYGSGALNGIISLSEREPSRSGETKVKWLTGFYDRPQRLGLQWTQNTPIYHQMDVFHGKRHNQIGYTIAAYSYTNPGYRDGENEERARLSGSIFYKPKSIQNLKTGVGFSYHYQKMGSFLIWESDSLAYTPSGGSDTSKVESTLSYSNGIRLSIDPYLTYKDKFQNKHQLKTRYYHVSNHSLTDSTQSALSKVYYADYQFQRKFNKNSTLTAGTSTSYSEVDAALYGNHNALNSAIYTQYEHRFFKKLNVTVGVRAEYFKQDTISGDSDFYFGKDSIKIPMYPIARFAAHYEVLKYTHIRASFGQGVRYPSVAERFTKTAVGSLIIFPNIHLKPEFGRAYELGVKQVIKINKWQGILDFSGFVNEYDNMMEFTFGFYKPDSIPISLNPEQPGYIPNWLGFMATNAEKARISGLEVSFNSKGKIGPIEILSLLGYTYMNPISLNRDSAYMSTFSDSGSTILKYRFKHLAKGDIELNYKSFSLGFSCRYNSYVSNIDAAFEDGLSINGYPLGIEILPGFKNYRETHQDPTLVFDSRVAYNYKQKYRLSFMINNLMNVEYMTRPGDIQAPRSFLFQISAKI
jgi:outer membrane receptor protein involved in Fe transport